MSRKIGLHFRLFDSYSDIAIKAQKLGLETIQIFSLPKNGKRYIVPQGEDIEKFLEIRKSLKEVYLHSSFKINLASGNAKLQQLSEYLFKKEIDIANKLQATAIVMHGGYANGYKTPASKKTEHMEKSLRFLINILNKLFEKENIKLLLENAAQGSMTVASNLEDFVKIRKLISTPNIRFCLDTAHAFEYGYDIDNTEEFIALLEKAMGLENIELIHLNDAYKKQGSKVDSHAPPGHGEIGKVPLQKLIAHPKLNHIPAIIELPSSEEDKAEAILNEVKNW